MLNKNISSKRLILSKIFSIRLNILLYYVSNPISYLVGIRTISRPFGLRFARFWSYWIHGDESYVFSVLVFGFGHSKIY